jgi:hypothetical protein
MRVMEERRSGTGHCSWREDFADKKSANFREQVKQGKTN